MPVVSRHRRRGFTLIELMVVILLIGMMAGIAGPRLLPLITMTEHQNEARHLVGYGRAAMAHASMKHENIVVRIDLDNQEYWTEAQPDVYEAPESTGDDDPFDDDDDDWIPEDEYELRKASQTILMGEDAEQEITDEEDQKKLLGRQKENMKTEFTSMAQNTLFARAKRVKHDAKMFEDDKLFDYGMDEDELDVNDEAGTNAVDSDLLSPHRVIESVLIESVHIGEEVFSTGVVDIELSPLGLDTSVTFVLINEDAETMVVQWDPLTGNAWYGELVDET
jgi:prepilin-type N-terminal cleavage/methylation domain-containing protein